MIHASSKYKKGFTMVETLVAIFILTLTVTGPLVIVSQALRTSYFARDQMVAYYLAQEAVELIRNNRDTNALRVDSGGDSSQLKWLQNPSNGPYMIQNSCMSTPGNITLCHMRNRILQACDAVLGCPKLKYDPVLGYNTNTGSDTNFSRSISIVSLGSGDFKREIVLNVTVSWNTGGTKSSFTLQEYLTNWKTSLPSI